MVVRDGSARVNVLDGGSITSTQASIGAGVGANAIASVSNAGSTWNNEGVLAIGIIGNGSLRVNDGGSVHTGEVWVGNRGVGEIFLSDDGALISAGIVRVGHNATGAGSAVSDGTLVISGGSQLTSSGGVIGSDFLAEGDVTITGAGSRWINDGNLKVGEIGTGSLLIEDGGLLSGTTGSVNDAAEKSDIATIRGADSQWLLTGELRVGGEGTGQLNIEAGGNVTSGNSRVSGVGVASSAAVTIIGVGSVWDVNDLVVGGEGEASVSVSGEGAGINGRSLVVGNTGLIANDGIFSVVDEAVVVMDSGTVISGENSRIQVSGLDARFNSSELMVNNGFLEVQDFGEVNVTSLSVRSAGTVLGNGKIVSSLIENQGQIQSIGLTLQSDVMMLEGSTLSTESGRSTSVLGDLNHNGEAVFTDAGASLFIGGVASGNGAYTGTGDLMIFTGELSPGNSVGAINFDGNVMLDSLALTTIELSGINDGEFDQLFIDGDFLIGGVLSVSLIDGFSLTGGMEFQFADVEGNQFGFFSRLSDGGLLGEGDLVGNFGGQDLFITYDGLEGNGGVGLFTAVPEPGSTGVMTAFVLVLLWRRKRH